MPKLTLRHYNNSKPFANIEQGEVFRVETLGSAGVMMKVTMGHRLLETGDPWGSQHQFAIELATGTARKIPSDMQCVPLSAEVTIEEGR